MTATVRGISANAPRSGSIDVDYKREYKVTYLVSTTDRNDGPQQVMAAFGVPAIGDVYIPGNDFDAQAIVTDVAATQAGSPWEWEVEVTYSTDVSEEPEQPANPLDEPAEISWGWQDRRIIIPGYWKETTWGFNFSGPPKWERVITSSNGEIFVPAPEVDISEPVLSIRRNVASYDNAWMMGIANCVNESEFLGASARQLRLKPGEAIVQYDKTIGRYFELRFQMTYRYETWDVQLLNQGTFYKDGTKKVDFKSALGEPFVGLLTSTGGAINSTDVEHIGTWYDGGDDPTFTTIRWYREVDFNSLGLI